MAENRQKHRGEELKSMSLGDHLDELRVRLILALTGLAIAVIISFFFGHYFVKLLLLPYEEAVRSAHVEPSIQAIKVTEPFMVYIKAVIVAAVLISCPWLFYQIWAFVSAGLYQHERKFVYAVAPFSAALFITGVLFFLFVIGPLTLRFFVKFKLGIDYVKYIPSLADYINFVLILSVIFGAAFQSPIAIIFAERMGLVSVETLAKVRKYVFLAVFVIAAAVTPSGDMITQTALAVPLYVLYEGSIIICRLWRRKRQRQG
ncbi:MAG: twin-arginine translocase subunit TatC [Planctomycetales bacterium]|nr:twin-arginine translocase subunit TatC [Planctomycetales bacterium]